MAESITLTTPISGQASISVLRPCLLILDAMRGRVTIQLREWVAGEFVEDGRFREFTYDSSTTPTGASLIVSLNKANLSTTSLEKRIMNQLLTSGFVAGTVGGTVD